MGNKRNRLMLLLPTCGLYIASFLSPFIAVRTLHAEDCESCHREKRGDLSKSVHGEVECNGCHIGITTAPRDRKDGEAAHPNVGKIRCSSCHADQYEEYAKSVHNKARDNGVKEAAVCFNCHGTHDILTSKDPRSRTYYANVGKTCGNCHADEELIKKYNIPFPDVTKSYGSSIHGKAIIAGKRAAECADCHGMHNIQPGWIPESRLFKPNVVNICGKCHKEIAALYEKSIHGEALRSKHMDAPTCIDCHGEHIIRSPKDPKSRVYASEIPKTTCKQCHGLEKLNAKYGIQSDVVRAYEVSFHGLSSKLGELTVANCESCHGAHNVLPHTNPDSPIHPDNIPKTCNKCHPGSTSNFTLLRIHDSKTPEGEHIVVFLVRWIYIALIAATIGFMTLHNVLMFKRCVVERMNGESKMPDENPIRFTKVMRIQHLLLTVTFTMLAYTGFTLAYPDSFLAYPFKELPNGVETRSILHRIFAVILVLFGIWHLIWIVFAKKGREEFREMVPRSHDLTHFVKTMKYLLSSKREKPMFEGKYEYSEKIEYWAALWGTAIMTITGAILWFINWSLSMLSKTIIDTSEVVHFYEAILAVSAVVIWHFYWVIFHPEIYPMNFTWITGRKYMRRSKEDDGKNDG